MSLPKKEKRETRSVQVGIRLTKRAFEALESMRKAHHLSQADVIEYLILHEFKAFEKKKRR